MREGPPARSPTAGVVVEAAEPLEFRVAGASIAGGRRAGARGGGGSVVVAGWPVEARPCGSAAGQVGLDIRWEVAGGGDEKKAAAINKRRGAATSLVSVDGARGRRRRRWRRMGRPIGSFRNGGA